VVPSFHPIIALMLADGVSPADCFRIPRDPAVAFSLLRTEKGRLELSYVLRKPVGGICWERFDDQLAAIERIRAGVVTHLDEGYPPFLRDIAEAPPILFYRGDPAGFATRGIAIVGCRRASARGAAFARALAGEIAARGVPVTSGAALGIDAAAHRGALDSGGVTVAVVGTGLDIAYPERNAGLLDEIASRGCVVSEQLMGTPALKFVFPRRNRLISAFSRAVIVVEAGERSGALITARWALEQGRDVGAVPGFPGDERSRGANALIKTGAFPVERVEDVFDAVPLLAVSARDEFSPERGGLCTGAFGGARSEAAGGRGPRAMPGDLPGDARAVLDAVGSSSVDADAVARHLGSSIAVVQRLLLELELRGLVERDAAGLYSRC
jgi:DNA processing protein